VRLRSPDPFDKPRVLFNYLSHEEDWIEMRACVRWTRESFAQAPFDEYRGDELQPGSTHIVLLFSQVGRLTRRSF